MSLAPAMHTSHRLTKAMPSVDLAGIQAVADLQHRFDQKYLVDRTQLPDLIDALPEDAHVLEVNGKRTTTYTSQYFDTDDLRTYRDHVQRRRRRFKVRTRHYGDPKTAWLEVKSKARRGATLKRRWPHPAGDPRVLDAEALRLIDLALREQYGFGAPDDLMPSARIRFRRTTLLLPSSGARVTIDLDLTVSYADRLGRLGASHAVVETKEAVRRGTATQAFNRLGLRPARISKYGVGLTAVSTDLRGNRWKPALRTLVADEVPAG